MAKTTAILTIIIATVITAVHNNVTWSSLTFNLPNTRYCQPCLVSTSAIIRAERSVSTDLLDATDRECQQYVDTVSIQGVSSFKLRRSFIASLQNTKNELWFIYFGQLAAQIIYERIYKQPYTLIVYLKPNDLADDDFCFSIYTSGHGFRDRSISVDQNQQTEVDRGKSYEKDYLNGIADYWVTKTCNATFHGIYIENARNRFLQLQINSRSYRNRDVVTGAAPIPHNPNFYSTNSFPHCGEKFPYREHPADNSLLCKSPGCSPSPKRRRVLQPLNIADKTSETANPPAPEFRPGSISMENTIYNTAPNIYINELYPCIQGSASRRQFIELRFYPVSADMYIKEMKLVILSLVTLRIVTVVNLNNLRFNENGLLAVYGNERFVHVSKDVDAANNLLPCSVTEPMAVLLLRKPKDMKIDVWNTVKLHGRKDRGNEASTSIERPVTIKKNGDTVDLQNVLKDTVVDAYLYGQIINSPLSETVLNVLPRYNEGCNFILSTGIPGDENEQEMSISFCPETAPTHFTYKKFKLGNNSPAEPNHCPTSTDWLYSVMEHTVSNTVGVTSQPTYPEECPAVDDIAEVIADITHEIELISTIFNETYESSYFPVPEMADYFLLRNLYNPTVTPEMISPFEHVPQDERSTDLDGLIQVRCKICHLRLKLCPHSIHSSSRKERLSQQEGIILPTNEADAQRILKTHVHRKQHYYSILNEIRHHKITLSADRRARVNREVNDDEKQLAAAFLTSFTLLKTNTAVHNSKVWHRTMALLNADVSEHWNSQKSVWNLMNFVSNEGESNILRNIMELQLPFSFLLDASSDKSNRHYVLFFIQTTEGEYSIVYLIGLIQLGKSSTAEAYLDSIKTFVRNAIPGFEAYFKANCVALVTDAASTMTKLHSDFNNWLDRKDTRGNSIPILSLYCLSHKLQLVSRNSMVPLRSDNSFGLGDSLKYFTVIETITQNMYTFLKLGSRRIAEFRETAVDLKQPNYEIVELHTQRWISSEHRTVKHFLAAWITTTETMVKIVNDGQNYPNLVRENANKYLEMLCDKNLLITMVYLQDYTSIFKVWSEHTQHFAGLLIDQERFYYRLDRGLTRMEVFKSPVLTSFLQSCKCSAAKDPEEFGCEFSEYELSVTIMWRNQEFTIKDETAPALSILGPELIKKTRIKMKQYIPKRMIDAFGVLQPRRFPAGLKPLTLQNPSLSSTNPIPVYGRDGITQLAVYFGLPIDATVHDWGFLVHSMLTSDKWEILRKDTDTNSFWARAIKDDTLAWTDLTYRLIRSAKAVSGGTAVVESGFSQFNVLKNQRRCRLTDDHVKAALSVLINGPEDVDNFDMYHYANLYKKLSTVRKPSVDDKCNNIPTENENEDEECLSDNFNENNHDSDEDSTDEGFVDIYDYFLTKVGNLRKPTRIRSVFM